MFKKITPPHGPQWRHLALGLLLVVGALGGVQAKLTAPLPSADAKLLGTPVAPQLTPDAPSAPGAPDAPLAPVAPAAQAAAGEADANAPSAESAPANPYGLRAIWGQGDFIAKTTVLLLGIMSLLSWHHIILKLLEQRQLAEHSQTAKKVFSGTESLKNKTERLGDNSPFRQLTESAMNAARRYYSLSSQVEMSAWLSQDISRSVSALQMKTQDGLSVLATVGSTAPFVGLFGTVWGIYNALVTIGVSGQASIDKVAGPVGESLIMTALGLAVAVPAILGYNWLVRRNRVALHGVKWFGSELHTLLLIEIEKSHRARELDTAAK